MYKPEFCNYVRNNSENLESFKITFQNGRCYLQYYDLYIHGYCVYNDGWLETLTTDINSGMWSHIRERRRPRGTNYFTTTSHWFNAPNFVDYSSALIIARLLQKHVKVSE